MSKPKHYRPEPGDEFIRLRDIGPEHKQRVFEARNQSTGEGVLGNIVDADHYLLQGVVGIRFANERLGIFEHPDALILLKPEGYELPKPVDENAEQ